MYRHLHRVGFTCKLNWKGWFHFDSKRIDSHRFKKVGKMYQVHFFSNIGSTNQDSRRTEFFSHDGYDTY